MYLNSEYVTVFPVTRRSAAKDPLGRITSEMSLTSIVNKLINTDGFIISDEIPTSATGKFEFNIHGYYFCITKDAIDALFSEFSSDSEIHAKITLDDSDGYVELLGGDIADIETPDVYTYEGLAFDSSGVEPSDTRFSLKLFEKSGGSWSIYQGSRYRFKDEDTFPIIDFDIDDGEFKE